MIYFYCSEIVKWQIPRDSSLLKHLSLTKKIVFKTQLNITLNSSTFPFSEHWHPEFMEYGEMTHPYQPKAYRSEDWMKKKGLGRRYSKYHPKLSIPLEDEALVYKLPKTNYEKDQFWGSWEKIVNWFKLFILDAELTLWDGHWCFPLFQIFTMHNVYWYP